MRINLPNQITLGRLVLTAILFVLLGRLDYASERSGILVAQFCFWIYIVAATSDILDGYLARKQQQVTSLGRILDPFADKILICGAFIMLAGAKFYDPEQGRYITDVQPWMVVVIVARELLVSSLRGFSEGQGTSFAASVYGKIKMLTQAIAVGVILGGLAGIDDWISVSMHRVLQPVSVWAAVIVTALSIISYLHAARSFLSQTTAPPDQPQPPSAPGD
ncbi:MAG: CDP-diacylglycerol--glycerol-3-phosphate 3-phosphatidyltransferase [Phycisphaerae bacterium]|nr:CDP-diacylglycerol--glycerol-3-phosphate 3-phosphatidyltransferase [Phycisphaerae bacterium]